MTLVLHEFPTYFPIGFCKERKSKVLQALQKNSIQKLENKRFLQGSLGILTNQFPLL